LNYGGVSFSAPAGQSIHIGSEYAGQYNNFGVSLQNTYNVDFSTLNINFTSSVNAFGFFFGASDAPWTLSAYDSSNLLIESYVIGPTYASNAGDFFGIHATNIASATLTGPISDYIFVDNFSFGAQFNEPRAVPGPIAGAGLPALFALAGACLFARRRRKAPKAA
jgi:hypothetical protein